jgi:hypothetical protein
MYLSLMSLWLGQGADARHRLSAQRVGSHIRHLEHNKIAWQTSTRFWTGVVSKYELMFSEQAIFT